MKKSASKELLDDFAFMRILELCSRHWHGERAVWRAVDLTFSIDLLPDRAKSGFWKMRHEAHFIK